MPKYEVSVPEVWYQKHSVEARNAAEALEIVMEGRGETVVEGGLHYSHRIEAEIEVIREMKHDS